MMLRLLKPLFLVHAISAAVAGAPLLLAPGRILTLFAWAPIDPILTRLLGAGLLALGWTSWRAWHADNEATAAVLVEAELVFTALGCMGLLRHLLQPVYFPPVVWLLLAILAVFAALWLIGWLGLRARMAERARTIGEVRL